MRERAGQAGLRNGAGQGPLTVSEPTHPLPELARALVLRELGGEVLQRGGEGALDSRQARGLVTVRSDGERARARARACG